MATVRQVVMETFLTRLAAIQIANGFETDAGATIFVNETPELGPDDPRQALAVVVGDEAAHHQGENVQMVLPIEVQGIVNADLDPGTSAPWLAVEAVLADIKRAVELVDRLLGDRLRCPMELTLIRTLRREDGSAMLGVGVLYTLRYVEAWGAP